MVWARLLRERKEREAFAPTLPLTTTLPHFDLPTVLVVDTVGTMSAGGEEQPRLSRRLKLVLFGEQAPSAAQLLHARTTEFAAFVAQAKQGDFTVDAFLPRHGSAAASPAEVKATRDNFKFFVATVAALEHAEEHASRTMHNIIVRHEADKAAAYAEAVSYFGKISSAKFDLLFAAGVDLLRAARRCEPAGKPGGAAAGAPAAGGAAFGADLVFAPPVVDEMAGFLDAVQPSAGSSSSSAGSSSSSSSSSSSKNNGGSSSGGSSGNGSGSTPPAPAGGRVDGRLAGLAGTQLLQLCRDHVTATSFHLAPAQLAEEIVKLLQKNARTPDHAQEQVRGWSGGGQVGEAWAANVALKEGLGKSSSLTTTSPSFPPLPTCSCLSWSGKGASTSCSR